MHAFVRARICVRWPVCVDMARVCARADMCAVACVRGHARVMCAQCGRRCMRAHMYLGLIRCVCVVRVCVRAARACLGIFYVGYLLRKNS